MYDAPIHPKVSLDDEGNIVRSIDKSVDSSVTAVATITPKTP
jgi:hypothetical protein